VTVKLYVECIKLYRRWVPTRVRDWIGRVRSRRPAWTEARAAAGHWYFHDYSKPRWDLEYRTDKWRYMHGLEELSRYSVVIGYARYFHPEGSLLDLGSGEGILQQRLGRSNYSRYVGVDVSQAAIDVARSREDGRTRFLCSDVATFVPDEQFDVIVFNEVLYYFSDPVLVLRHYEQFLKPDGIFIVSMFADEQTFKNWATLESAYEFLDETRAGNAKSGCSWSCRVARPSARRAQASL
jgi:2-polyprenyl-3-methyl-5-hydroxy-6-metoxy-1,4-benzoquinol methylase